MRAGAPWAAPATVAAGRGLGALGLPSPYLFAGLLLGLAVAIARPDRLTVSDPLFAAAQAVTGVTLGAYLQSSALSTIGEAWLPVALAGLGTLLISLAAGVALARWTPADTRTAALGWVVTLALAAAGCSTRTWRRPRAASTPCSPWRSAPAPTPRSSWPFRACACSRWCCSRRSPCAGRCGCRAAGSAFAQAGGLRSGSRFPFDTWNGVVRESLPSPPPDNGAPHL